MHVQLAVLGAHLRRQPLNEQLLDLGASFLEQTQTAPHYRLFASRPAASDCFPLLQWPVANLTFPITSRGGTEATKTPKGWGFQHPNLDFDGSTEFGSNRTRFRQRNIR
jgi:hypothetical protein